MSKNESIVQSGSSKPYRTKSTRRKSILALILVAAAAAGLYLYLGRSTTEQQLVISDYDTAIVAVGDMVSSTESSGTVVLPVQATLVSQQDGYVSALLVKEGDQITEEDVLLILELPDLEESLKTYEVELEQAQLDLEEIHLTYGFTVSDDQRALDRLDEDILEAQEEVDERLALSQLKSSRMDEYESALETLEALEEDREDLLVEIEQGSSSYDISVRKQEAVIRKLELSMAEIQQDISEGSITSPIAGEILSINEDIEITGNYIEQSDSLLLVADRSEAYVDLDVYEQYAGLLTVGDTLSLTIGTDTLEAGIEKIGKIATLDSDGLTAMVTVRVRPITDSSLTPGASAVASIILGVNEDTLLLPRASYLTTGNQKYIYVIEGDQAVRTEVTYGDMEGGYVEILSGLEAGDLVITSSYQQFIDRKQVTLGE